MTRRRRGVLPVPLRRVREGHPVPCYARDGDAGMDLFAAQEVRIDPAGGRALVATGVAVAIPAGYAALILPRSGLALRHGVTVLNAPGLIDSGYRGEQLKVLLLNTDPLAAYHVSVGGEGRPDADRAGRRGVARRGTGTTSDGAWNPVGSVPRVVSEFPPGSTLRALASTGPLNAMRHACRLRHKATRGDTSLLLLAYAAQR